MKYRIGFVTNSSSSSSVIVKIIMKDKQEKIIEYEQGHAVSEYKFHYFNNPSYQDIHDALVIATANDLMEKWKKRFDSRLVDSVFQIDMGNGVYINREISDEVLAHIPNREIRKILEIDVLLKKAINSYEDLMSSKVWTILNIPASEVKAIHEKDYQSGDDFSQTYRTKINVKTLSKK